jgi:4-amino-4-deoxy-L-arabinose transferase-like glycosyltransferase
MDLLCRRLPLILAALAFLVLAPQYWIALSTPAIGIYHDDSIYLLSAKSLAEGEGYRIPSTPANMVQTKYPVLYPAVLSLVWRAFPDFPANVVWFKALSLMFCLGWLALSAVLLNWWLDDWLIVVSLVALIAASPPVIFLSTSALSEMQFAFLLTGCLLLLFRADRDVSSAWFFGAGLLAGMCYLTRSVGFVLIVMPIGYLVVHRKIKAAVSFALPAILLAAPWLLWQFQNQSAADPYLSQSNYYSGYNVLLNHSWPEKIRIVTLNMLQLMFSPYVMFFEILPKALGFVIIVLGFVLVLRGCRRDRVGRLVWWAAAGNVAVLLLWVWPPLRFVIPWLPVFMLLAWRGVSLRFRNHGLVLVWALFACASASDTKYTVQALRSGFWCPSPLGKDDWKAFVAMADWAKKNIDAKAILQSSVDPTVYLYTGHKAVRGFGGNVALRHYLDTPYPLGRTEEYRETLIRADVEYVFFVHWAWFSETPYLQQFLDDMAKLHPGELRMVHAGIAPGFAIYRFKPGLQPESD